MSSLKDKLSGNCTECEARKQAMIKAWKETKAKIQAAFDKQKKPK